VAPTAGGPAEIVEEGCGRLYPPGDAEAAAAALVEILETPDLARQMGATGRARASWFEADEARSRFAQVVVEAVAERKGEEPAEAAELAVGAAEAERTASAPQVERGLIAAPALRGRRGRRGSHATHHGAGMALVTVTHNSAVPVERLLRSVDRYLPGAHVVVVDSGSSDRSAIAARAAAPRATVIELGENVGFGRASNAGLELVEAPVTVLINPDVELVDSSLADLAGELLSPGTPERILAPSVLSPDGSRQDTGHLDPGSPLLLLKALVPPAALPGPLRALVDPWRSRRSRRVGWAVAACLLAPTATLRRLGPFDERIFMYAEDMDLGLRAAEAGVETIFRPDARVVHLDAHSTEVAFGGEPFELLARQRRAVIGEHRGEHAARRDDRIWLLTYLNRIALKTLTRRPTARERRQLAALRRVRDEPARLGEPSAS
jgi:N-acetylglucosaminyl-diphospho-decaprenol L-rhamnosyltransferase